MKSILVSIVLLAVPFFGLAQATKKAAVPGVKVYLDAKMQEVSKGKSIFFRKAEPDGDNGWLVMVYFNGGELKMQGHYIDAELTKPHGEFVYHYQNGQIESKGLYENGAKIGVWERWNPDGSPKAERFYTGYQYGDDPILDPDEMPEFVGGQHALHDYLSKNLEYPSIAKANKAEGEVYVTFVVNKVGQIEKVGLMKSVDPYLDKEAIRVVESMPQWLPGKKNGNLVKTQMAIPVTFKLNP
jgi:TonB family protein